MPEREISGQMGEGSGGAYRTFLLRCSQEPGAGLGRKSAWRFTLVTAGDEPGKHSFISLEELVGYLQMELDDMGKIVECKLI